MIKIKLPHGTKLEDIFEAMVYENVDWENEVISEEDYRKLEYLSSSHRAKVKTYQDVLNTYLDIFVSLTDTLLRKKEEKRHKYLIMSQLNKARQMFLVKDGDHYIEIIEKKKIDENYFIDFMVPFTLFNKNYSFEKDEDGNPQLIFQRRMMLVNLNEI